jgi:hypothetical protein
LLPVWSSSEESGAVGILKALAGKPDVDRLPDPHRSLVISSHQRSNFYLLVIHRRVHKFINNY